MATSKELTILESFEDTNLAFSSIVANDTASKVLLYNAVNSPDAQLSDFVGKTLLIADVVIEKVDLVSRETGDIQKTPRVVIIDKDKKSYSCASFGIYNAIRKLATIFGTPSWSADPIKVEVQNLTTSNGKKTMTLKAL